MDDINIFIDQAIIPTDKDLATHLGSTFIFWVQLRDFVMEKYPNGNQEWHYPGQNYGWSFRIKDKKRTILYFMPRENYFKVALVFGQKAIDAIMQSNISLDIKHELILAKKYAEGRGIRIDIKNDLKIPDIKKLIEIKLSY